VKHNHRTVVALLALSVVASASDWPRFRGPNGTGVSPDKNVPVKWTAENVLWKVALPGSGNSSPVVMGGKVYVQTASPEGAKRALVCLSAVDGHVIWSREVPGKTAHTHKMNTLASSTPAVDGNKVFAYFWDGAAVALHAFDLDGKPLWNTELGTFKSQHGPGSSPVVHGDRVFVNHDQDGAAKIVAFNTADGKVAWEQPRKAFRTCYSIPFLREVGGSVELVVGSTAGLTGYNPSTGSINWNWEASFSTKPLRTIGGPTMLGDTVFMACGDGDGSRQFFAVKAGTGAKTLWEDNKTFPYVPCILSLGKHIYWVNDRGIAGCNNAEDGKPVWVSRLGGNVSASPVMIDGKVFAVSEEGDVFVFAATPEKFELLAKNSVGELVRASPAVADDRFFVRGSKHLFCIGKK